MNRLKIGDRFGALEVVKPYTKCVNKKSYSLFKCDCGQIVEMRNDNVKRRDYPTCGCGKRGIKGKDKKGDTFGKLTIIIPYVETVGTHTYHYCQCECGNFVKIRIDGLRKTYSCGCMTESKGERRIAELLTQCNINFKRQYSFENLIGKANKLKFDFAIFENNNLKCLIEYNGEQHYKAKEHFGGEEHFKIQQEYDNKKKDYCKNNNIPLIIIPYLDYEKIDTKYLLNKISEVKENA